MDSTWRLIPPIATSGKMQMAIDRYLLEQHRLGQHPSTLRFYTWRSPTISLGYHQKAYPSSWPDLVWQDQPVEIVRRPTGGRAVLHQGDLTYMVVTSLPTGKRLAAYKQICQFIIQGWQNLGIKLIYGQDLRDYTQHHNCFATATGADLLTPQGHKVIGSAQLRKGQSILQHGSMMLSTDHQLYQEIFQTQLAQNLFQLLNTSNLEGQQDDKLTGKIIESLTQAAIAIFKIDLAVQPLTTREWQYIANDFSW